MYKVIAITAVLTMAAAQENLQVFKINLDDPPKERFAEPSKAFADQIVKALEFYEANLINLMPIPAQLQVALDYGLWWAQRERY